MAYSTATLTGTYKTFDDQPASGVVEVIPNSRSLVDAEGDVILAGRVKVTLDGTGSFTVTLPATDDATVEPATGRQYTVVAKLRHTHLPAVTGIELPTGATVDVADVASSPVVDPVVSLAATTAQLDALEASVAADLAGKADAATVTAHTASTANPHGVTKAQVGLGNVDNTSDAAKPVSTATATALAAKLDAATGAVDAAVAGRVNDAASSTRAALSATFASKSGPNTFVNAAGTAAVVMEARNSPDDGFTDEMYLNKPLCMEGYWQVLGDANASGEFRASAGGFASLGLLEDGFASLLWVKNAGSARMDWGEGAAEAPTVFMSLDTAATSTARWALWNGAGVQKMRWNSDNNIFEFAGQATRWYSDNFGTAVAEVKVDGTDAGLANFWNRGIRTRMTSGAPANGYSGEVAVEAGKLWVHDGTGWKSVTLA